MMENVFKHKQYVAFSVGSKSCRYCNEYVEDPNTISANKWKKYLYSEPMI